MAAPMPGTDMRKAIYPDTHKKAVAILKRNLIPIHHKTLYEMAAVRGSVIHSKNSTPYEKFRQRYGNESPNREIIVIPNTGELALRDWFPQRQQMSMFPPSPPVPVIEGDCIVSYEAGYDLAKREPFMMDYFNDADSTYRKTRRRSALLAEKHIANYFKANYPNFFKPASNDGLYHQWAKDDFSLRFPSGNKIFDIKVDVKTWTDDKKEVGLLRNPLDKTVYIFAEWLDESQRVKIDGIEIGENLKLMGESLYNGVVKVAGPQLLSADILLVILNMAKQGLSYHEYAKRLRKLYPLDTA